MPTNNNPFKPDDLKRRLLLSIGAGLGFMLVIFIAAFVSDLNALIALVVGLGGGGIVGFMVWQRT